MRWPWTKAESCSAPYTDAVVQAIQAAASGRTTAQASATAALETASGIVSRSFASAQVRDGGPAGAMLSPAMIALIGCELIRRGECVLTIEAGRLVPAASWDVRGGWTEDQWNYRLDVFGPSGSATRYLPSAGVVHPRYSTDPARPWCGVGPLASARLSGRLLAEVESALADESSMPRGAVIPIPNAPDDGDEEEGDDTLALLRADVARLKGQVVLTETLADGYGEGRQAAPGREWEPRRIGANPPDALVSLRTDAAQAVLAACGVPVEWPMAGQGTAAREAYRRFLHSTLAPLGELVQAELREKLDAPGLALNFDSLFASDLSGRARAFGSLVQGGMDVTKAAGLSGLLVEGARDCGSCVVSSSQRGRNPNGRAANRRTGAFFDGDGETGRGGGRRGRQCRVGTRSRWYATRAQERGTSAFSPP